MPEHRLELVTEVHDDTAPLPGDWRERLRRWFRPAGLTNQCWVLSDALDGEFIDVTYSAWTEEEAIAWATAQLDVELLWDRILDEDGNVKLVAVTTWWPLADRIESLRNQPDDILPVRELPYMPQPTLRQRFRYAQADIPTGALGLAFLAASVWIAVGAPTTFPGEYWTLVFCAGLGLTFLYVREVFNPGKFVLLEELARLYAQRNEFMEIAKGTARTPCNHQFAHEQEVRKRVDIAHRCKTTRTGDYPDRVYTMTCSCNEWSAVSTPEAKLDLTAEHYAHTETRIIQLMLQEFPDDTLPLVLVLDEGPQLLAGGDDGGKAQAQAVADLVDGIIRDGRNPDVAWPPPFRPDPLQVPTLDQFAAEAGTPWQPSTTPPMATVWLYEDDDRPTNGS